MMKNEGDVFVYENVHSSIFNDLVNYQLDRMPVALEELGELLKSVQKYTVANSEGLYSVVSKAFSLVEKELYGDLELGSSVPNHRYELLTQNLLVEISREAVDGEKLLGMLKDRYRVLQEVIMELRSDVEKFEVGLAKVTQYSSKLRDLAEKFLDIKDEYSLSDIDDTSEDHLDLVSIKDSEFAKDIVKYLEIATIVYQFFSFRIEDNATAVAQTKKLLEIVPKITTAKAKFIDAISTCVTQKLLQLWSEIEECEQRKLQYAVKIEQLSTELQRFEEVYKALNLLPGLRVVYEVWRDQLLSGEEKIMVLEFKLSKQSRLQNQVLRGELNQLRTELSNIKKNKEFQTTKKKLITYSDFFPELHFWYNELNPLSDLAPTKGYPTKDFETDFIVEKELSSRVLLVKQTDGNLSVLKKFNLNQERSLLRHAIEITDRISEHPNILRLDSIVHGPNNIAYLEYPYYPLGDLFQWRNSKHYDHTKVGKIFFDIVKGLQALHENQILHRDIKPQNVLISDNGAVLGDFDLSEFQVLQSNITFHSTNVVPQTANYIAPEVLISRKHTFESDLYSLGLTFAVILTGTLQFNVPNDLKNNLNISNDQKNLITGLLNAVPKKRTVLDKVLKNPFIRGDFDCEVCCETKMMRDGLFCYPEKTHYICKDCFTQYVKNEVSKDISYLIKLNGVIKCPSVEECKGCFPFDYISQKSSPEVVALYLQGQQRVTEEHARVKERTMLKDILENERLEQQALFQQLEDALLGNRQESRNQVLNYLRTEKMYEEDEYTRQCPNCRRLIQKIDGCNSMRCGENYHGGNKQYGCGSTFSFASAPRYKSKVQNLAQLIKELSIPNVRRSDLQ